jgi:hypothetical protein
MTYCLSFGSCRPVRLYDSRWRDRPVARHQQRPLPHQVLRRRLHLRSQLRPRAGTWRYQWLSWDGCHERRRLNPAGFTQSSQFRRQKKRLSRIWLCSQVDISSYLPGNAMESNSMVVWYCFTWYCSLALHQGHSIRFSAGSALIGFARSFDDTCFFHFGEKQTGVTSSSVYTPWWMGWRRSGLLPFE